MPGFVLDCWCWNGREFQRLEQTLSLIDSVEQAKRKMIQYSGVEEVALFACESETPDENASAILPISSLTFKDAITDDDAHSKVPFNSADMIEFDRRTLLGEIRSLNACLVLFKPQSSCSFLFWPVSTKNRRDLTETFSSIPSKEEIDMIPINSLTHIPSISQGDYGIGEILHLKTAVVDFVGGPAIIPEYEFPRLTLSVSVPFVMRRSLCTSSKCLIRAHSSVEGIQRNWPFRNLKCTHTLRPSGILFRVRMDEEFVQLEYMINGDVRVSIEDWKYPITNQLQQDLIGYATKVLSVFASEIHQWSDETPINVSQFHSKHLRETIFEYSVFTSVNDIRSLIDDESLETSFVEPPVKLQESHDDIDVEDDDETLSTVLHLEDDNDNITHQLSKRIVTLHYKPKNVRNVYNDFRAKITCRLSRSLTNGISCRIVGHDTHPLMPMIAASYLRKSIHRALPKELGEPRSTLKLMHVDPELYFSLKNCGYSRKTWTCTEHSTGCTRYRQAIPINPFNLNDQSRYMKCLESGPMMFYRGVWYAALQDEEENGDAIRKLRLRRPKDRSKELEFYNWVVLKEVTETKYRNIGYDAERFRYIPACVRFRKNSKLPLRTLAIMAPLYRRNEIKFQGRGTAEMIKQLNNFGVSKNNQTYVMKANKTLGVGNHGEIPLGPLNDYLYKILRATSATRKGVFRDRDQRFASSHAILSSCNDPNYLKSSCVEDYVRTLLPLVENDTRGVAAINDEVCEILARQFQINIIVFHHASFEQDIQVTFVGNVFTSTRSSILLIRSLNGALYEPVSLDGNTMFSKEYASIPIQLQSLYKAICPAEYQRHSRLKELETSIGRKCDGQYISGSNMTALSFLGITLPFICGKPFEHLTEIHHDPPIQRAEQLVRCLHAIQLEYYRPVAFLVGNDGLHAQAIVLADTRLLCPIIPVISSHTCLQGLKSFENISLRNPYIGLKGRTPTGEVATALTKQAEVKKQFIQLLRSIQQNDITREVEWNALQTLSNAERRRQMQTQFILHCLENAVNDLLIPTQVMLVILASYCESHPRPKEWNLCDDVSTLVVPTQRNKRKEDLTFDSPNAFLEWIARQE